MIAGPGADAGSRRSAYTLALNLASLVLCTIGTDLVLVSGYCPAGRSCLAAGSAGAAAFGAGFACAAGALVAGGALVALGVLSLAAGMGGLAASVQGAGWVGGVIGGEFFANGIILLLAWRWTLRRRARFERERARLWVEGRPGRAVVVDVDDAGRRSGRSRIVGLLLRVDPGDGGERYTVEVDHHVGAEVPPRAGDLHEVRIDPDDPGRIALGDRLPS
ncbi:MAG TPA: hypothetical protein VFP72_00660 [Kineosporiaceae bacterium]|nr:hypothetical protein [Kineosporiaceae bacterium]